MRHITAHVLYFVFVTELILRPDLTPQNLEELLYRYAVAITRRTANNVHVDDVLIANTGDRAASLPVHVRNCSDRRSFQDAIKDAAQTHLCSF